MTQRVLNLTSECYTCWNYRKKIIQHLEEFVPLFHFIHHSDMNQRVNTNSILVSFSGHSSCLLPIISPTTFGTTDNGLPSEWKTWTGKRKLNCATWRLTEISVIVCSDCPSKLTFQFTVGVIAVTLLTPLMFLYPTSYALLCRR